MTDAHYNVAPQAVAERLSRALTLLVLGLSGSTALFLTLDVPPAIRAAISGSDFAIRFRMWSFNASLLVVGVVLGSVFAHRAGLLSLSAHRIPDARTRLSTLPLYAVLGGALGLTLSGVDSWLMSATATVHNFIQSHASALSPLQWAWGVRALYGGVTEELMWRWGVMSLATWLFLRWLPRRRALAVAILLSAFLFGLDHLPLLFQSVPDVPLAMVIRVVVLNMVIGIACGIAYVAHSLEAAMILHAVMHTFRIGAGVG